MKLADAAKLKHPPAGKDDHLEPIDGTRRFYVRVRDGAEPAYFVQYRIARKQRRIKIGDTAVLAPRDALTRAKQLLAQVDLGQDPQEARSAARQAPAELTLGDVAGRYLSYCEHLITKGKRRLASHRQLARRLPNLWGPLYKHPLRSITRAQLADRLGKLEREHGSFAAVNARSILSALYNWAIKEGLTDVNPVTATRNIEVELTRDRVLSNDELVAIWNALNDDAYGRIFKIAILTGQRRAEIGALVWGELDLNQALWTLPAARSKNGKAHEIPLSDVVVRILQATPRHPDHDFMFGNGAPFGSWSFQRALLDGRLAAAGVKIEQQWQLHDIRRTVATGMASIGVAPHIVEAVLNHVSGHKAGIAGVYNRATYAPEKRQALDMWAAHVGALVAGKSRSNVRPLHQRA